MRFLGRKVYLHDVVILVAAMRQGPSPRRVRELSQLFGADRRTIARWQLFWREHLPRTPFVTGDAVQFAPGTIERWYDLARRQKEDPVRALRRAVRKDCNQFSLPPALVARLFAQYRDHEHWTYPLHYDNLAATVKADPMLGPLPSYSTVRRTMQAHGHHGSLPVLLPSGQWHGPLALGVLDDHSRVCCHLQ